jgi:hypothetical protein
MRAAEDPVLLEQVVDDCLLVPIDPAGDEKDDKAAVAGSPNPTTARRYSSGLQSLLLSSNI